jgi:hypothetical protein
MAVVKAVCGSGNSGSDGEKREDDGDIFLTTTHTQIYI